MSNSTSAGLPTISEMVTFINNQELTLKIEDHVSMTGKTHHNLVVYFKPFHGKYYNWIRRYNGASSSPRTKNDHPGQNRIYLQIERRKTISCNLGGPLSPRNPDKDVLLSNSVYGCFKSGNRLKRYYSTPINVKYISNMVPKDNWVVYRRYLYDDRIDGKYSMNQNASPNRLQSIGRGFGKTVFLLRPQDAAKGYFVLRQDVIIIPMGHDHISEKTGEHILPCSGLRILYKTKYYGNNDTIDNIMNMYNGMRIRMSLKYVFSPESDMYESFKTSNIISRAGNIISKK